MSFDWLASLLPLDRQGDFSAAQLPDAASAWASASALLACDATASGEHNCKAL